MQLQYGEKNMNIKRCVCGEKPVVVKDGPLYDFDFKVKCNYCGIECPYSGRDELDAINEWNNFINRINSNK